MLDSTGHAAPAASWQHSAVANRSITAESFRMGSRERPRIGLALRFGSAGDVSEDEADNDGTDGKNVKTTREARLGFRGMAALGSDGSRAPQRQVRRGGVSNGVLDSTGGSCTSNTTSFLLLAPRLNSRKAAPDLGGSCTVSPRCDAKNTA